jgi:hypothetical protein
MEVNIVLISLTLELLSSIICCHGRGLMGHLTEEDGFVEERHGFRLEHATSK